jgi:adenosylhomocysteinase
VDTASPREWVEVVLRRYARRTNRLLAGRAFGVAGSGPHADALLATLSRIGARAVPVVSTAVVPGLDAVFVAAPPHDDAEFVGASRTTASERIDAAARQMPVVRSTASRLARSGVLAGRRVGICLVLEPKTAVLALELARAGAAVSVYGHPEETDAAVAAALAARGIAVFADPDPGREAELADQFLAQQLHLLVDDGSRLIRRLASRPEWATQLIGAAEETTSGLLALREGEELPFPVVAVNDAGSKLFFDNAHGTGQSCLFTILDLLAGDDPWPLAGRTVVVAGFGPVGEGFARHAHALGADVLVADPDPVAELRARFAGYRTGGLPELVALADLVVSASGRPHTITPRVLAACAPGAVVAVAGGVPDEVDWAAVVAAGGTLRPVRDHVEDLVLADGTTVRLLDRGGCINCTAGEGNPIEIMDLSFGVQLEALETLVDGRLPAGIHPLPRARDRAVAALALATWTGEGR